MSSQGTLSTNPLFGGDHPDFSRLAGLGAPAIVALFSATGKTAAVTNAINFIPPAVAGIYRLTAYVDVTAWTTPASFTLAATFNNPEGTGKTVTMATNEDDGTVSALIDEVSGFAGVPFIFGIDATATAITLSTTGTFTGSPVYDFFAILERLK